MTEQIDKFWMIVPEADGGPEPGMAIPYSATEWFGKRYPQEIALEKAAKLAVQENKPFIIMEAVNVAYPEVKIRWDQPSASLQNEKTEEKGGD